MISSRELQNACNENQPAQAVLLLSQGVRLDESASDIHKKFLHWVAISREINKERLLKKILSTNWQTLLNEDVALKVVIDYLNYFLLFAILHEANAAVAIEIYDWIKVHLLAKQHKIKNYLKNDDYFRFSANLTSCYLAVKKYMGPYWLAYYSDEILEFKGNLHLQLSLFKNVSKLDIEYIKSTVALDHLKIPMMEKVRAHITKALSNSNLQPAAVELLEQTRNDLATFFFEKARLALDKGDMIFTSSEARDKVLNAMGKSPSPQLKRKKNKSNSQRNIQLVKTLLSRMADISEKTLEINQMISFAFKSQQDIKQAVFSNLLVPMDATAIKINYQVICDTLNKSGFFKANLIKAKICELIYVKQISDKEVENLAKDLQRSVLIQHPLYQFYDESVKIIKSIELDIVRLKKLREEKSSQLAMLRSHSKLYHMDKASLNSQNKFSDQLYAFSCVIKDRVQEFSDKNIDKLIRDMHAANEFLKIHLNEEAIACAKAIEKTCQSMTVDVANDINFFNVTALPRLNDLHAKYKKMEKSNTLITSPVPVKAVSIFKPKEDEKNIRLRISELNQILRNEKGYERKSLIQTCLFYLYIISKSLSQYVSSSVELSDLGNSFSVLTRHCSELSYAFDNNNFMDYLKDFINVKINFELKENIQQYSEASIALLICFSGPDLPEKKQVKDLKETIRFVNELLENDPERINKYAIIMLLISFKTRFEKLTKLAQTGIRESLGTLVDDCRNFANAYASVLNPKIIAMDDKFLPVIFQKIQQATGRITLGIVKE